MYEIFGSEMPLGLQNVLGSSERSLFKEESSQLFPNLQIQHLAEKQRKNQEEQCINIALFKDFHSLLDQPTFACYLSGLHAAFCNIFVSFRHRLSIDLAMRWPVLQHTVKIALNDKIIGLNVVHTVFTKVNFI